MTTINAFAERLTELRENSGKKRQEVADDINISRASLEYYEKGKRKPDIEVLLRLADYYNVTCDYLLKGVKTENVSIHEATGLSDKVIETLHKIAMQAKGEHISEKHKTIIQELELLINNVPGVHDETSRDWLWYNEELDLEVIKNKTEAEIVLEALNYIIEQDNFFDFMTMMYVYLFADVDTSKGTLRGIVSHSLFDDRHFLINLDKELLNESYLLRINNYLNEWKDRGRVKVFDLEVSDDGE